MPPETAAGVPISSPNRYPTFWTYRLSPVRVGLPTRKPFTLFPALNDTTCLSTTSMVRFQMAFLAGIPLSWATIPSLYSCLDSKLRGVMILISPDVLSISKGILVSFMLYVIIELLPSSRSVAFIRVTTVPTSESSSTSSVTSFSGENTGLLSFTSLMITVRLAVADIGTMPPSLAMTLNR